MKIRSAITAVIILLGSCKKNNTNQVPSPGSRPVSISTITLNNKPFDNTVYGTDLQPVIKIAFSEPLLESSVSEAVNLLQSNGTKISITAALQNKDSVLLIHTSTPLNALSKYVLKIYSSLKSASGGNLLAQLERNFITQIDSTDKFSRVSDSALLTHVQQQTFRYFWDFGHPVSGMSRERNTSGDIVTTGGTGFGIMCMLSAINRNFISRIDGLNRIQKVTSFLKNNCKRYHGVFSHWINGSTGATVPFSDKDDGADLVETSFLMEGLLCARQYFNSNDATETSLRTDINEIWNSVEWNWFRQNDQNILYWHWSPNYGWAINMPISSWNEALVAYVLAASSNTDSIPEIVYDLGWAKNGAIKNGNIYFGIQLPLGPAFGGPLFFSHYSFLGINPNGLSDAYSNYWQQDTAHAKINYLYCVNNPKSFYGYSNLCWGITASDDDTKGYDAHSPTNDDGVITPAAAISSLPYSPAESMNALKFFYYKLGDKIWGDYGFKDAFNLNNLWFVDSYLAIDQGPQIVMIENFRSSLLWNLFMSCPEIKRGMKRLGFQSPYLQ